MKNDRLKDKEKKTDTESLLGSLADERFALLVNLGKKITDFGTDEKGIANTGTCLIIFYTYLVFMFTTDYCTCYLF